MKLTKYHFPKQVKKNTIYNYVEINKLKVIWSTNILDLFFSVLHYPILSIEINKNHVLYNTFISILWIIFQFTYKLNNNFTLIWYRMLWRNMSRKSPENNVFKFAKQVVVMNENILKIMFSSNHYLKEVPIWTLIYCIEILLKCYFKYSTELIPLLT